MRNSDPLEPKVVTCPARGEIFVILTVKSSILGVSDDKSGFHIFDQKGPASKAPLVPRIEAVKVFGSYVGLKLTFARTTQHEVPKHHPCLPLVRGSNLSATCSAKSQPHPPQAGKNAFFLAKKDATYRYALPQLLRLEDNPTIKEIIAEAVMVCL